MLGIFVPSFAIQAFLQPLLVRVPHCCGPFLDQPRADLYGGYSYVNIDTNGLTSRQNANGWEASVSGNFNKWFAVEGDVRGYYKSYSISLPGVGSASA